MNIVGLLAKADEEFDHSCAFFCQFSVCISFQDTFSGLIGMSTVRTRHVLTCSVHRGA